MTAVIQDRHTRRMLELQAALPVWHEMNTERQWARLECTEHITVIEYGVIHDNGFIECAVGSKLFVAKEGWIVVVDSKRCG